MFPFVPGSGWAVLGLYGFLNQFLRGACCVNQCCSAHTGAELSKAGSAQEGCSYLWDYLCPSPAGAEPLRAPSATSCPAGGAWRAHTSCGQPYEQLVGELWGFANCSLGRAWRWSLFLVPYHQRCFIKRMMLRGFLWLTAEWFLQCNIGLEDLR